MIFNSDSNVVFYSFVAGYMRNYSLGREKVYQKYVGDLEHNNWLLTEHNNWLLTCAGNAILTLKL